MLKQLLLIASIIFIASTWLVYLFQRHLIYHPSNKKPRLNAQQAKNIQVVTLHTKDGLKLRSWYHPARSNQPTMLYLHGNTGSIQERLFLAQQFINAGLGILLLEYRGFGGNPGHPTEEGLYKDGRAGIRFLKQQGIKPAQLVLYGESLGTGVATKLALETRVCAVVLQSPYTSLSDLARYYYPWLFIKPWDRFDSIDRIHAIHAPLLIVHGIHDTVVPYSQGLTLFKQARKPKRLLSIDMEGHNDIWHAPHFTKHVLQFIRTHCSNNKQSLSKKKIPSPLPEDGGRITEDSKM